MCIANTHEAGDQSHSVAVNKITLVTLMSKGLDTGSWERTELPEH